MGGGAAASGATKGAAATRTGGSSTTGGAAAADAGGALPGGGMGGGMGGATSAELTALLSGTTSTWSAAVTLAQFQAAVANGEIHYYVGGGQGGPGESSDSTSAQIAAWVAANYPATTVGGQTVYDLTA
jgi:hypothetical protein